MERATPERTAVEPGRRLKAALAVALGVAALASPVGEANAKQLGGDNCTRIQNVPRGFYMGKACADDSYLIKEHNSYSRHFDYGVVVVNGVYKCGWVVAGVIPTKTPQRKPTECQQAFHTLRDPFRIYKKLNCPPGECDDGAVLQEVTQQCDDPRGFANFATSTPSVFNLHPDSDNSGLSDVVADELSQIRYRARTRLGSEDGKAAVVRANDHVHWVFMAAHCAPITHGGPPNDGS